MGEKCSIVSFWQNKIKKNTTSPLNENKLYRAKIICQTTKTCSQEAEPDSITTTKTSPVLVASNSSRIRTSSSNRCRVVSLPSNSVVSLLPSSSRHHLSRTLTHSLRCKLQLPRRPPPQERPQPTPSPLPELPTHLQQQLAPTHSVEHLSKSSSPRTQELLWMTMTRPLTSNLERQKRKSKKLQKSSPLRKPKQRLSLMPSCPTRASHRRSSSWTTFQVTREIALGIVAFPHQSNLFLSSLTTPLKVCQIA